MSLLTLMNVSTKYGSIDAIKGISLGVQPGEIVSLIGANGAGKTTLMKTIAGLLAHHEGSIVFQGRAIDDKPGHKRVRMGVVLVPEGREVFAPLTVEENLLMGAYLIKSKKEVKTNQQIVYEVFGRLHERRSQIAGTLSGGEQQMLAIGRALMARPQLLMLDEPSLGLAPLMVQEIFQVIQKINLDGKTILLVEQNAQMALSIAARGYVLESGKIVIEDSATRLRNDERVRQAYLGA